MRLSLLWWKSQSRSARAAWGLARRAGLSVGLLIILMSFAPLQAGAQQHEATDAQAPEGHDASRLGGWSFEFTPYLWLPEMYGKVQVRRVSASFHVGYDEIFDLLGDGDLFAGMGHFEARNGRLSLFADAVGGHATPSGSSQRAKVDSTMNFTFVEFGPAYRLLEWPTTPPGGRPIAIEALAGGRFMYFYSSLSVKGTGGRVSASDSASVDWVDPFVGGRWLVPIVGSLDLFFRGDIGGFGAGSQLVWNVLGGFQYHLPWKVFSARTRAIAGYKVLDFDYQTGGGQGKRAVTLNLRGPALGIAFDF